MNITHVDAELIDTDKLQAIFNKQRELMGKYHDIELRSGLLQTEDCPVNLNDKRGQARIKDFAWRVTEELGEAIDAIDEGDQEHFKEELVDGLHFLTELTILAGYDAADIVPCSNGMDKLDVINNRAKDNCVGMVLEEFVSNHVRLLGMTCNCLKNKPWKQSMMITDEKNFYEHLKKTWWNYISMLCKYMTTSEIYLTYVKKNEVNKFRQRSNY